MNKHIICYIKPFIRYQEVWVYIDGTNREVKSCTIDNLAETIYSLADRYQIQNIDLAAGNALGIKIRKDLLKKYPERNFNITIHSIGGF